MPNSTLTVLTVLVFALIIDAIIGDPPNKFHLTAWMGKLINALKPRIKNKDPRIEKVGGIFLTIVTILVFTVTVLFILLFVKGFFGVIVYIAIAGILLKFTFALKSMERHTTPIANALIHDNIDSAKRLVSFIVRRDPEKLSREQIISAAVESIAEGTVDGVTSPLFYFAFLGVPGAVAFRVINTLDSEVGYKNSRYVNIGWFSAKMDTLANYLPARITAFFIAIAAMLLREDCKNSLRILKRDRNKTESLNGGWVMSAMAGALHVQLEKPRFYILGDRDIALSPQHICRALRIMKLTVFLFVALVTIPLTVFTTMISW